MNISPIPQQVRFPLVNGVRRLLSLAAGITATICMASAAQAAEVILQGNNVVRIENLEVFEDQGGSKTYDVYFLYAAATSVYGSGLAFDFTQEEEAFNALEVICISGNQWKFM